MPETEPEGLRERPTHGLRIKPLAMRIAAGPRRRHRREERRTRPHELLGSEERLLRGRRSGKGGHDNPRRQKRKTARPNKHDKQRHTRPEPKAQSTTDSEPGPTATSRKSNLRDEAHQRPTTRTTKREKKRHRPLEQPIAERHRRGRRPTRPGNTPNRTRQLTGRRYRKDPTRATHNRRRRPNGQLAKPSGQPPAHLTTLGKIASPNRSSLSK